MAMVPDSECKSPSFTVSCADAIAGTPPGCAKDQYRSSGLHNVAAIQFSHGQAPGSCVYGNDDL